MNSRGFLSGNLSLDLAITAWFLAQLIKVVLCMVEQKMLDLRLIVRSGGMPSSHSAFVCAAATSIERIYGLESAAFALAAVVALVVMYDACNVRRSAGEHAEAINELLRHSSGEPQQGQKALKERLGHTPLQVLLGALLGIGVGLVGPVLLSRPL